MGDPKFARPKTRTPTHPWKQARIDEEHALKEKYGLKKVGGMKEIWREKSSLRRHRNQAMKLIGRSTPQRATSLERRPTWWIPSTAGACFQRAPG